MLRYQQNNFYETLQKKDKTRDEGHDIHLNIQRLSFYKQFSKYLKSMDNESILTLCQSFQYEKMVAGEFVFEKWEPSNAKFYVILSGQVSVLTPKNKDDPKDLEMNNLPAQETADPIRIEDYNLNVDVNIENDNDNDNDQQNETQLKARTLSIDTGPTFKAPILLRSPTFSPKFERKGSLSPSRRGLRKSGTSFGIGSPILSKQTSQKEFDFPSLPQPEIIEEDEPSLLPMVTEEVKEEIKEEPKVFSNLYDDEQYQEYAAQFGNIERTLHIGDSFGELAIEDPSLHNVIILCKSDCEFLVLPKSSFELVFNRKEHDKEFFLKATFPLLTNELLPLSAVSGLINAFKLETFGKGSYLTTEGKVSHKDSKFYVIYKGECLVEKTLTIEKADAHNKSGPSNKHVFSTHIAVIGKGMLVGEEVIVPKHHEYNYNVKVLSDKLEAYSITKDDLKAKSFHEFDSNIIGKYERRKKQREALCENAKKDFEAKTNQLTNESVLASNSIPMKHLIRKPAILGLTRHIQRESRTTESGDSPSSSFCQSPKSPATKTEYSQAPLSPEDMNYDFTTFQRVKLLKQKSQLAQTLSNFNFKEQEMEIKIDDFEKVSPKANKNWSYLDEMEAVRLFSSRSPKKLHEKKVMETKSFFEKHMPLKTTPDEKSTRRPFELILRGHVNGTKRFRFVTPEPPENQPKKNEKKKMTSLDNLNGLSPSSLLSPQLGSPMHSPVQKPRNSFQAVYDSQSKRAATAYSVFRNALSIRTPHTPHQDVMVSTVMNSPVVNESYSREASSYLGNRQFDMEDFDKRDYNQEKYFVTEISPIKPPDTLKYLLNLEVKDIDTTLNLGNIKPERIGIIGRNVPKPAVGSRPNTSPLSQKNIEELNKLMQIRLHAQPKPTSGTKRENAREVRRKLFQKPPRSPDQAKSISVRKASFNSPLVSPKYQK